MPDENVVKGKLKNAEGRIQEAWGDLTDNSDDKATGQEKQKEGKLLESTGHLKDAAKAASESVKD